MELLKAPNVRGWGHPVFMVRSREGHPAHARTLAFMWRKANRRAAAEKTVRKIETEAIACVVAQTVGLSTGRSHTFSVRIVQCEIGTHIVARLVLRREEGKVFK